MELPKLKTLKGRELLFLGILVLLEVLIIFFLSRILLPSRMIILSLALIALSINLIHGLEGGLGRISGYLFLLSVFSFNLMDVGIMGAGKILTFLLTGLIVEGAYLALSYWGEGLAAIVSTSLDTLLIPLISAFFISPSLASTFPLSLVNLCLVGLMVGIIISSVWELGALLLGHISAFQKIKVQWKRWMEY